MSLSPGTRVGPYEILGLIGAGGMGEVYRARDTRLDRDVAIKVLAPNLSYSSAALARFEREAKAIAALSHPAILAIYDFATHEGTPYAVTELLAGQTLRERLATARYLSDGPSSTSCRWPTGSRPRTTRASCTGTEAGKPVRHD